MRGGSSRARSATCLVGLVGLSALASPAAASPLEALPDLPGSQPASPRWSAELSTEITQPLFDALGVDRQAGQAAAGSLGVAIGAWSFTLGGQQRRLQDKTNVHDVQSWHAAAQVELTEPSAPVRWGLRLGAWGNRADHLLQSTSSSLRISGLKARLVEMELVRPRDLQWQLDLLGRTALADPRWSLSGVAGLGSSAVTRSVVNGKATISGCTYQLDFGEQRLNAAPLAGCANGLFVSVPNRLLAIDVQQETRYHAVYGHVGAAVHWAVSPWRAALGAEWQQWQRVESSTSGTRNLVLAAEAVQDVSPGLSLLLRGQVRQRQMLGEVPMLYNSRAASSHRRVVALSAGLQFRF